MKEESFVMSKDKVKGNNALVNALKKSNMTAIGAVLVLMIIIASVA